MEAAFLCQENLREMFWFCADLDQYWVRFGSQTRGIFRNLVPENFPSFHSRLEVIPDVWREVSVFGFGSECSVSLVPGVPDPNVSGSRWTSGPVRLVPGRSSRILVIDSEISAEFLSGRNRK